MPRDEAVAIERVVLYLHFTYYLYVSFCDDQFLFVYLSDGFFVKFEQK